jgi:hypothetical protein
LVPHATNAREFKPIAPKNKENKLLVSFGGEMMTAFEKHLAQGRVLSSTSSSANAVSLSGGG